MGTELKIVLSTCPNIEVATALAEAVVTEHLAACVNILPVQLSVYEWGGKICKEPEILLVVKTTAEKMKRLEKKIAEIHPYDVPEFVVVDTEHASEKYLGWVVKSVSF